MTASSGRIFIAITPCRLVDTRYPGGAFGTPSLVRNTPRIFPVPASDCGVPVAAAYSMNFVSITPAQGGIVDNAAIVPAGADGGIQVMATANCDLVIDLNRYYVQTGNLQGPAGPQGPQGPQGRPVQRSRKDRLERWERLGRRERNDCLGRQEPPGRRGRLRHLKAHGILPRRMRPVTLYLKTDPATSRLRRTL